MKKQLFYLLLATGVLSACGPAAPQLGKDSVEDVIGAMTLEEKAHLVIGTGMVGTSGDSTVIGTTKKLVPGAAGTTYPIPRLGIPAIVLADGPAGLRIDPIREGDSATYYCTHFPIGTLLASTWNQDLVEEVGKSIGNEVLEYGADVLLAPALNIHRNPLCGRNFEYYSEDSFLSGAIAAAEVKGIQSKGVYVYIKHFVLNDSETACRCISTWANEQSIREVYLKPFEMAIVDGGAMNVMNSFARLGVVWSGGHEGLMTNVLRGEWGMKGFGLTDFSGNAQFESYGLYMKTFDVARGLLAGTDCWDSSSMSWTNDLNKLYKNDPDIVQAMRQATHRILYTVANSNAMNGLSANQQVVAVTPWWQTALYVVCAGMGAMTVVSLVMALRCRKKRTDEKKKES